MQYLSLPLVLGALITALSGETAPTNPTFERKWLVAQKKHQKAKELVIKGLHEARKPNTARKLFRAALAHDAQALRVLRELKQTCKVDDACMRRVAPVLRTVRDHTVRTHLHIADLYRDRSAELVSRGLRSTRSLASARKFFLAALRQQARAERAIDELRKRDDLGRLLPVDARTAIRNVRNETIRIRLHIAHLYTSRQNYNRALRWVNGALAMDRDHKAALEARARIEIAISNSD